MTTPPTLDHSGRAGAATALYLGALLIGMALVSVPSSSVYLKALHGLDDREYGGVFIAQLIFAIGGALLAGPAVRRMSQKSIVIVALACFLVSQLALALSAQVSSGFALYLIMACLAFFGFGFGFGGGPLNGIVVALFPNRSDTAIAAVHLMAGVGLMIGPLFFRYFETRGVWIMAPGSLVVLSAMLIALAAACVRRDAPISPTALSPSPAGSRYFWLMMVIAFLYSLVEGAFSNWAVIYVTGEKGLSADTGAAALSLFWGGLTVGRLLATVIVGRVGAPKLWLLLPPCMIAAFFLVLSADESATLLLAYGFAGLACSAFFPLMVAVAGRSAPDHISWIASMLTAALMLGVGVGAYAIGALLETLPISRLYMYLAILPAATMGLMLLQKRDTRGSQWISGVSAGR